MIEGFQDRLNRAMKNQGISPGMLAIKTGISDKMIRNYQKGKFSPSAYSLRMIAKALRVSVDWLIGTESEEKE